jgi:hypothetical protein
MLNTKSIKKNQTNIINNTLLDYKQNTFQPEKIINIESSKQKELVNLVKQANIDNILYNSKNIITDKEDNEENKLNTEKNESLVGGLNVKNSVQHKEFTNSIYQNKNLNLTTIIEGNKILNNEDIDILKINQNMPIIIENNKIEWNDIQNCYLFYTNNNIECTLSNENILKSILNQEHEDLLITKKYIFIISWNSQTENYEFNFINSKFTNNLDLMIRLQNFIYDTLNNFDNLTISDTYNYYDTIIIFYYQLIIFLFNNYNLYFLTCEPNKISRLYSTLSYRFSSIILKNIYKIKNNIFENNEILNKLITIRSDMLSQISFINDKLSIPSNKKDKIVSDVKISDNVSYIISENNTNSKNSSNSDSSNSDSSNNSTKSKISDNDGSNKINILKNDKINSSLKSYKIVNSKKINYEINNNTLSQSDKIKKLNIKNKHGKLISKLKDIFSDDVKIKTISSDNQMYNSDDNVYKEINDSIGEYFNKLDKFNKIDPIENLNQNEKSNTYKDISYNPNSALLNGQIYKINL